MSDEELLLKLLRSLPKQSFEREIDLARTVVPELVSLLGFHESETFYDYGTGRYRADVVLASSITSTPWIIIELKRSKPRNTDDWIYQVKRYLGAFNSSLGVLVSPELLILVSAEQTQKYDLRSIEVDDARHILYALSRSAQSANPSGATGAFGKAVELVEAVENATTNTEKGNTLEALARFLFGSVCSLKCKYANFQTRSSEIDLVIEYDRSKGELPLFEELGRYCLVECKNWSKPVGVGPVRDFMGKLDKCKTRLGIIFSKNGVTGVDSGVDALREIQSMFDRNGVFVLVFSLDEIKGIKSSNEFYTAIDFKADRLRFDAEGW